MPRLVGGELHFEKIPDAEVMCPFCLNREKTIRRYVCEVQM